MVRVGNLAKLLSQALDLETVEAIHTSGRLHDIGKQFVDQHILNKPERLSKEEFEHMQKHVVYSAIEVMNLGYSVDITNNVLMHHENYDGTGYPFGIKGEEIPLGARILRICDCYDALTMERPYRKKLDRFQALMIMDNEKEHFDPNLYGLFKKII